MCYIYCVALYTSQYWSRWIESSTPAVTINDAVNTDVNVSIVWYRNGGSPLINSSDYCISPISLISDEYISTIRIEELMTSDNGATYFCSVSIQPSSLSSYITGSNGYRDITLSVEGMYWLLILVVCCSYTCTKYICLNY